MRDGSLVLRASASAAGDELEPTGFYGAMLRLDLLHITEAAGLHRPSGADAAADAPATRGDEDQRATQADGGGSSRGRARRVHTRNGASATPKVRGRPDANAAHANPRSMSRVTGIALGLPRLWLSERRVLRRTDRSALRRLPAEQLWEPLRSKMLRRAGPPTVLSGLRRMPRTVGQPGPAAPTLIEQVLDGSASERDGEVLQVPQVGRPLVWLLLDTPDGSERHARAVGKLRPEPQAHHDLRFQQPRRASRSSSPQHGPRQARQRHRRPAVQVPSAHVNANISPLITWYEPSMLPWMLFDVLLDGLNGRQVHITFHERQGEASPSMAWPGG